MWVPEKIENSTRLKNIVNDRTKNPNYGTFTDNFIFFNPYPIERLKEINHYLESTDLSSLCIIHKKVEFPKANWLWNKINQVLFQNYSFIDKAYSNSSFKNNFLYFWEQFYKQDDHTYSDEEIDNIMKKWQEISEVINPLVEYMGEQLNATFPGHQPRSVFLNIMPPNTKVHRHSDTQEGVGIDYRVTLVLSTNDASELIVEGKGTHLPQGTCFAFDNSTMHEFHNNHLTQSRTHLVIDFSTTYNKE